MIIKNCKILKRVNEDGYEIIDGNIAVEDGIITHIGDIPKSLLVSNNNVIDGEGKLAIPGLINSHYHSHNNFLKGLGENLPLEPWMYYSTFATEVYELEDIYANTMLGAIEMIRSGVTSFIDHIAYNLSGIEMSIKAYEEAGLRVAIAPLVSDLSYDETIPVRKDEVPKDILVFCK